MAEICTSCSGVHESLEISEEILLNWFGQSNSQKHQSEFLSPATTRWNLECFLSQIEMLKIAVFVNQEHPKIIVMSFCYRHGQVSVNNKYLTEVQ